ncbi:energy-coupling factor ABC transporter ATP-binding protein [Dongia soli]|uniref:ABC transporter ATP-binding protein n=1 Tax=Dongia soli TaxID=600628 RepID=A0ABU5EEY1_9PROT|nr:ATP-binding cassette domain-containing protein [Dongia soli]MDY0884584.1 ATP-binding cassette domain-containing protein [Dongia soli]
MLEIVAADYSYPGGIAAVSGIGLALQPGEKVAILGPNGAGKTTLLTLLNGTIRPDRGSVRLDGQEIRYDKAGLRHLRRQVGLVLQDPDDQLFAASVFEDVSFGPLNLGLAPNAARGQVDAALAAMRIEDLRDRPTHMLSFGQRKRVAIAGIVAMQPRYLLLDEPSAGLDPFSVSHLMAALRRIAGQETAILLTTHDIDMAYGWADRIVIFGEGRIACDGAPEDIFADRALLHRLHMRPPLIWEIAQAMRAAGMLPATGPLPRTRRDLLQLIGHETATMDRIAADLSV